MAFKKFACLRIGRSPSRRRSLSPRQNDNQIAVFENQIPEEIKGRTNVKLVKSPDEPLGLTIAGGCDKFSLARVEHLRAGGMASRCDLLQVGDLISAVNGIRTSRLKHEDIINLLKNVGDVLNLELEYELPPAIHTNPHCIQKVLQVTLNDVPVEGTGKGFVIRGGFDPTDSIKTRPLVVSYIRPDSIIDKQGTIKIGDKLIAAGNHRLDNATLSEALEIINKSTIFTFQYSVSIVDQVQNATGPLLIEVAKPPGSSLGISLSISIINQRHCIVISEVKAGSIADRCGALHIGDQILKIDGHQVDSLTLDDATRNSYKLTLLRHFHARLPRMWHDHRLSCHVLRSCVWKSLSVWRSVDP